MTSEVVMSSFDFHGKVEVGGDIVGGDKVMTSPISQKMVKALLEKTEFMLRAGAEPEEVEGIFDDFPVDVLRMVTGVINSAATGNPFIAMNVWANLVGEKIKLIRKQRG
jgi:hypothetical protein